MTSSSRAGDQTSSPCFCLTWPIWSAISGAPIEQGDQFLVDPVDLAPQARQGRRPLRVGGAGTARRDGRVVGLRGIGPLGGKGAVSAVRRSSDANYAR